MSSLQEIIAMFGEEYINRLPDDEIDAAILVCNDIKDLLNRNCFSDDLQDVESAYFILASLINNNRDIFGRFDPVLNLPTDLGATTLIIAETVDRVLEISLEKKRERSLGDMNNRIKDLVSMRYNRTFYYEFSEGDLKIVQLKINDLRDIIITAAFMDEDFKLRLLKRLEKLQYELHKKTLNLDRFWGLLGEAGVATGKFGEDAKPMFDRIREILEIVWRTQARSEELPSNSPVPEIEHKQT